MIGKAFIDFFRGIGEMFSDAVAFFIDPEAKQLSRFKYPNSNPISVRTARKQGLAVDYPKGYKGIEDAPENKVISVMWGEYTDSLGYGKAIRVGNSWFIRGASNPYANGRSCAEPTGWHPE